uniref:Chitin-binding type-2 domain-containing protein n=1 Tax=Anopheles epiroticus TaxID=199890 RepID=A0A182PBH2_9DIPT
MLFLVHLLLLTVPDVRGQGGVSTDGNGAVRTVMDLMEVMLNRDILDMLKNGGFDFREPARIFLPPKFYSIVPQDPGHMSVEQILGQNGPGPGASVTIVGGGKTAQRPKPSGAVSVLGGSRINLISYSDGKVTTAGGRPAATNKGSETLEKNVGTNVYGGPSGRTAFGGERTGRKQTTPAANDNEQQPSLTTTITDQTVSQNVGRTLPTSGRGIGGGSTTDQLRSALPGEPDVDYPILSSVPVTQFSCEKRHHGYYADVETRCQVFRVCANTDSTGRGFAFLCPNGTLFNQRHLVCDWYMNVRCEESESLYSVNEAIGQTGATMGGRSLMSENKEDMMKVVMSMVTYPMRSLMDTMNGVGVIEPRLRETGKQRQDIVVPPTSRRDEYVVPGTGLQPPFKQERTQYPESVPNDYRPAVNNYRAGVSTPVSVPRYQGGSNTYRPKLDNVYVSSLGTLSTDSDSGFDPLRSTLITGTEGSLRTVSGVPQSDSYGIANENQPGFAKPIAADVTLVRADLIKSWDDQLGASAPQQTTPLKLTPVPRISQPTSVPTSQYQFQPHAQTPGSVFKQAAILPPTGVLPPSSLTRTVPIGGSRNPYTGPSAHRFAPVRTVLPIQRVTVVPENSYQLQSHTRPANFHQQGPARGTTVVQQAANLPYVSQKAQELHRYNTVQQVPVAATSNRDTSYTPQLQQLRRSDSVLPGVVPPVPSAIPRRRPTSTVLQVVPALSFYLNDAQEKRAFEEAVRQGLLDERGRRTYTSYDVPLGSVGHLCGSAH